MRIVLVLLAAVNLNAASLILLTDQDARGLKNSLPAHSAEILRKAADKALNAGPWTVTSERPPHLKLTPNEYYSEAPYFWPDSAHPGKSLRKDGERNPNRLHANHDDLGKVSNAVLDLGLGAYLFDDARYAKHAQELIQVWFLDPKTGMNPNLQHAQAVIGENDGRPTGIIDTVSFIHCVQGMALLERSGKWDAAQAAAAKKWFADYLTWLTTSGNGVREGKSGNNHETWWTAQVAAFATFTGNEAAQKKAWDWQRTELLKQIKPDGSCPREEARTNSLGYSTFNLDAFSTLCRIAQVNGVDLWSNGNLPKALHLIAPYAEHPADWKGQQISKFTPNTIVFPGLAGVGLHDAELLRLYARLPRSEDAWVTLIDAIARMEQN